MNLMAFLSVRGRNYFVELVSCLEDLLKLLVLLFPSASKLKQEESEASFCMIEVLTNLMILAYICNHF